MRSKYSLIPIALLLIICFHYRAIAQTDKLPAYFNGITLDAAQLLTADEKDLTDEEKEYRKRTKAALERPNERMRATRDTKVVTLRGSYGRAAHYRRTKKKGHPGWMP